MFTEEQKRRLLDPQKIHNALYYWVREHVVDVNYKDLTQLQRRTLDIISEMPKSEQKKYVIIDDILVEAPTKVTKYAKTQGKWTKRDILRCNYTGRKA